MKKKKYDGWPESSKYIPTSCMRSAKSHSYLANKLSSYLAGFIALSNSIKSLLRLLLYLLVLDYHNNNYYERCTQKAASSVSTVIRAASTTTYSYSLLLGQAMLYSYVTIAGAAAVCQLDASKKALSIGVDRAA